MGVALQLTAAVGRRVGRNGPGRSAGSALIGAQRQRP